jgi:DNA-directed RNA polymerase specialized sigma24 family protein
MATPSTSLTPGRTMAARWTLASALLDDLHSLDATPQAVLALRGWGTDEPALVGIATFAELRDRVHHGKDADRVDEILLALARLASIYGAGDALAARVLLALMATGLAAWRRRLADLEMGDPWCYGDEVEQALAAELAVRIRTWRGTRAVAANLLRSSARDVRERLLRQRDLPDVGANRTSLDMVTDHDSSDDAAGADSLARRTRASTVTDPTADPAGDAEVRELFEWVVTSGALSAEDAELVRARRLLGFSDDELAAATGMTRRSLQRRCQRAEARLVVAVGNWAQAS